MTVYSSRPALLLLNSLATGGSERKSVLVAAALAREGWPVELAYLNPPHDLAPLLTGTLTPLHLARQHKFDPRVVWRLRQRLLTGNIGSVWSVNLYPVLYAASALWGLPGRRLLCALNTSTFSSRRDALKMVFYAPLLRRADHLLFGCRSQMAHWLTRYHLSGPHAEPLYNGVDASHFDPALFIARRSELRAGFGLGPDDFVMGSVAQLRPEKNLGQLLDAAARLRATGVSVQLLMAGEGAERPFLEERARQLGLAGLLHLPGRIADVRPLLAALDVFVLPSIAVETFSNAALEAMAMACPVILAMTGGAEEMITPGVDGFLFPSGDVEALTDRLQVARKMGSETGSRARVTVQKYFSWETMLDHYRRLLFDRST
ncbi:MAG: glycosyltransferase family 4 protein [Magnetococcus sp. DMHC-1]|nr:glycosyltransferase family 4 protein [Magnetococcales bacterium]